MSLFRLFRIVWIPSDPDHLVLRNQEPFNLSSLTIGSAIKSSALILSILNFLLLPFSTHVFKAVVECSWISLLIYLFSEQASLFAYRSVAPRTSMFCILGISTLSFFLRFWSFACITDLIRDYSVPVPLVLNAATNAGILILGCNSTNIKSRFQAIYLALVAVQMYLSVQKNVAQVPAIAVFTSASWENVRLLASFLCLRLSIGTLLHSIIIGVTREWALRGQLSGFAGRFGGFHEEVESENAITEKANKEEDFEDSEYSPTSKSPMRMVLNLSILLILLMFTAIGCVALLAIVAALFYNGKYAFDTFKESWAS